MQQLDRTLDAIGTRWRIEAAFGPGADVEAILARVHERIELFDRTFSRFRDDSLVSRIARSQGTYTLPDDATPMLALYRDLYDRTDGAFTPLIGQALSDAGYDAAYSLQEGSPAPPPAWDAAMTFADGVLTTREPVLLDFGAAGKGYLVDLVAGILTDAGALSYVVDAGGDMRIQDPAGVRVALEHPADTTQAVGIATLTQGALCGSAGNRRAWGRFHHILDPESLSSPMHVRAVWVYAASALLADALATALWFAEPDAFAGYAFEYAIVRDDYAVSASRAFPAELFIAE